MVRRRTCPGLDGRKQRFSTRKSSKKDDGSDDESNSQEDVVATTTTTSSSRVVDTVSPPNEVLAKKRASIVSSSSTELEAEVLPKLKKPRSTFTDFTTEKHSVQGSPVSPTVDTSIIRSVVEANNRVLVPSRESEEVDDSSMDKRNERLEMLEQSLVVSDVAMKLEEYAKRARKDAGISTRSRRGGAGVVTPPFGSSSYPMSASALLTYDDEYETTECSDLRVTDLFGIETNSSVVTDTDAEEAAAEEHVEKILPLPEELMIPPVSTPQAKSITERLLTADVTSAAVAGFCMSTAPIGNPDTSRKILQLIASCENLASDFHQYRSALKPITLSSNQPYSVTPLRNVRMNHVQNWEREVSRCDAVRDFKVFSVNCVHKILGKNGLSDGVAGLSDEDRAALERTADVWLKSVGQMDSPRSYVM